MRVFSFDHIDDSRILLADIWGRLALLSLSRGQSGVSELKCALLGEVSSFYNVFYSLLRNLFKHADIKCSLNCLPQQRHILCRLPSRRLPACEAIAYSITSSQWHAVTCADPGCVQECRSDWRCLNHGIRRLNTSANHQPCFSERNANLYIYRLLHVRAVSIAAL